MPAGRRAADCGVKFLVDENISAALYGWLKEPGTTRRVTVRQRIDACLQCPPARETVVIGNRELRLMKPGGRILRAVFARSMDISSATRRAVSISNAIAMVLMVAGLFSDNWLSMIGVIVFSAAQLEERALVFQSVLDTVRLEEVMLTDFATLSPADTLEDALQKAVHSLQDDFPVVRGSDMVGVISRQRILDALRSPQ